MKTSNRLIVCALLLILLTQLGYDNLLKAEFISGRYKDAYRDYVKLNYKDFDVVDLESSTAANVKFVQGPFKIIADSAALSNIKISQEGKKLTIKAAYDKEYLWNANPYLIVISCPILSAVHAGATYTVSKNIAVTDTINYTSWNMRGVLIDGFKQDSLTIIQDYGSTVELANNHLTNVTATIGKRAGSGSKITLLKGNQLKNADFEILNRSELLLNNEGIENIHYHLADSARLTIGAQSQNLFKKQ
ncbi:MULTISPECIES: hypothetical protein [unclassified Mucilaginibacter]|uniref:hypothetical protein n=1 Tax=unclassified Mucilaginibacter TaxID=2617802 RepID=UPI002AC91F80|nr:MULTISPECIES: hypothetical protein [unclassified Mucilaginibacter]MEB0263885.1 hypothetical protein [Mucilaginibacter sp. 10I4]MEB0279621.1 hypothetical protein [Mucilaginibacter sp. 10B2]MEB0300317.1 hypothetical protein [Mucilaginibacter sp. 5C4]WPX22512.1 hypothetical protein RHM67_14615 [Mucilaginibacter sp. 5C4]